MAWWFNKSKKLPIVSQPHIPAGERVYAIGDIHGRADLLQELLEMIRSDQHDFNGKKTIVYLGDYIDRGDQSKEVIDILLSKPLEYFNAIHLLGNHEQAMLDFMTHPLNAGAWITFGGRETLSSYSVPLAYIATEAELPELAVKLSQNVPDSHIDFLNNCQLCWQCGSYYFVHAGILPGLALDKQVKEDQLWIRDEFLFSDLDHGAIIVHGHSISLELQNQHNRIGIDTGAYASGTLTCLVLEGKTQRFLQTGATTE